MSPVYDELVKRVIGIERQQDNLPRFEKSSDLASPLLALPMLRGAWLCSVDSGGDWYDISGHGHTLSYNGDPQFAHDLHVGYWDLDGTGDFFDRATEADLEILGTETYVAAAYRGLTAGGWLWADALQDWDHYFSKTDSTGVDERSWRLMQGTAANESMWFSVSGNGIAWLGIETDTGLLTTSEWHCCFGRFRPVIPAIDIFFDGQWWTNTTDIPASLHNSTASLVVGSWGAGAFNLWDGRAANLALCACACSREQISSFYQQTRAVYNR